MKSASLLLLAMSSIVAAADAAPKEKNSTSDTIALITQHRPTSTDGEEGIFRMQGELGGGMALARGSADDVLSGTVGFWLPIVKGDMAIRFGTNFLRYDFSNEFDVGFGDLAIRWDWAPQLDGPHALLVEVDTSWDTARDEDLGANTHTIAPGVAYVIDLGKSFTFAPGFDHRLDWGPDDGQDISLTRIHGYFGWPGDGRFWVLGDPNINIDSKGDRTWLALEAEGGMNLGKNLSAWVRPSLPLGDDRPYDVALSGGVNLVF